MVLNIPRITTLAKLGRISIVNLANAPLSRCLQIMENAPLYASDTAARKIQLL
jgi:hypothetical protein